MKQIITVDNETTLDRDDGISYENGILGIHITKVPLKEIDEILKFKNTEYNIFGGIKEPMILEYKDFSLDKGNTNEVLSLYINKNLEIIDIKTEKVFVSENYTYKNFINDQNYRKYQSFYFMLQDFLLEKGYKDFDIEELKILGEHEFKVEKRIESQFIIQIFAIIYNYFLTQIAVNKGKYLYLLTNNTELDNIALIKNRGDFLLIIEKLFPGKIRYFNKLRYLNNNKTYKNNIMSLELYGRFTSPLRRLDDYLNQLLFLGELDFNLDDYIYFEDVINKTTFLSKQKEKERVKKFLGEQLEIDEKIQGLVIKKSDNLIKIAFGEGFIFEGNIKINKDINYNISKGDFLNNLYIKNIENNGEIILELF